MKTVLCYGDSNTYGFMPGSGDRYPAEVRWPGRLQQLLGSGWHVVEEGLNGRTTNVPDPFEPWKSGQPYLIPCLASHKPIDVFILMLGSNDLKSVFHRSAEEIAAGAESLLLAAKKFLPLKQDAVPRFLLIAPPPVLPGITASDDMGPYSDYSVAQSRRLSECFAAAARRQHCDFLDAGQYTEISPIDCLHFTPEDHLRLADAVAALLRSPEA